MEYTFQIWPDECGQMNVNNIYYLMLSSNGAVLMLNKSHKSIFVIEPDDYPSRIGLQCGLSLSRDDILKKYPILNCINTEEKYERFSRALMRLSLAKVPMPLTLPLIENMSTSSYGYFVLEYTLSKIDRIPDYMSVFDVCGLSKADAAYVLSQTSLTSYDVKNIRGMIDIYLKLGIPTDELRTLILNDPNILNYESTNSTRVIDILYSLGMSTDDIRELTLRTASDNIFAILDFNIMKNKSIINSLKTYEFTDADIIARIKKDHHVLISDLLVDQFLENMKAFDIPKLIVKTLIMESPEVLYSKSAINTFNAIKSYKLEEYMHMLILEDRKLFVDMVIGNLDVDSEYAARLNMLRKDEEYYDDNY